ncbi:MAG: sensor histidine kinase [Thermoleophilia bacterium]
MIIARSDQGRLPVRPERIDPADLLTRVRNRFVARAAIHGRRIVVGLAGPVIDADPLRLEQALGNLVENAIVHGEGTITLGGRERDGGLELFVDDDGRGLPPEFAPRAFERFSRVDPARGRGGAGLGLSIVRAIARAHGGEARIENRTDRARKHASILVPRSSVTTGSGVDGPPAGAERAR